MVDTEAARMAALAAYATGACDSGNGEQLLPFALYVALGGISAAGASTPTSA